MSRPDSTQPFLVVQMPQPKFRASMSAGVAVVFATTAKGAIRKAVEDWPDHISIGRSPTHNKPKAYRVGSGYAEYI